MFHTVHPLCTSEVLFLPGDLSSKGIFRLGNPALEIDALPRILQFHRSGFAEKFRFPAKLTVIKEKAFRGNGFLEPVELPPSVRLIEGDAFTACSRLRHVIVPEDCFIIAPNFRRAEIRFYSKPEEKF